MIKKLFKLCFKLTLFLFIVSAFFTLFSDKEEEAQQSPTKPSEGTEKKEIVEQKLNTIQEVEKKVDHKKEVNNKESSTDIREPLKAALKDSDDYDSYSSEFLEASMWLVENDVCKVSDIKENGGWVKSIEEKAFPVYFTYCGGYHLCNKIYINLNNDTAWRKAASGCDEISWNTAR